MPQTCFAGCKKFTFLNLDTCFFLIAGSVPSNNELSGKSIDKMNPSSRDDFDTFEALLKEKITQYEVKHLSEIGI